MNIESKSRIKKSFVNFVGALGYFFCFFQWFWALVQYLNVILPYLEIETKVEIIKPITTVETSPNMFLVILGAIITVSAILVSIYIFIKTPSTISSGGKKIVQKTALTAVPIIIKTGHIKNTKKNRIKLTARVIFIIKTFIIIAPIIISYASILLEKPALQINVVMAISLGLAGLSFVNFAFQYLFARIFHTADKL